MNLSIADMPKNISEEENITESPPKPKKEKKERDTTPKVHYRTLARWVKRRIAEIGMSTNAISLASEQDDVQYWLKHNFEAQGYDYNSVPESCKTISQSFLSQVQSAQTLPMPDKWNVLITTLWVKSGQQKHFQVSYTEMLSWCGLHPTYAWENVDHNLRPDEDALQELPSIIMKTLDRAKATIDYLAEETYTNKKRMYGIANGSVIPDKHELEALCRVKHFNKFLPEKYQNGGLVELVYPRSENNKNGGNIDRSIDQNLPSMNREALRQFFSDWFNSFSGKEPEKVKERLFQEVENYSLDKARSLELLNKAIDGTIEQDDVNLILPTTGERMEVMELDLKTNIPVEDLTPYDAGHWNEVLYNIPRPKENKVKDESNHLNGVH